MVEITRQLTAALEYNLKEGEEGIIVTICDCHTDDLIVEHLTPSEITRFIRDLAAMMMCSVTLEKL